MHQLLLILLGQTYVGCSTILRYWSLPCQERGHPIHYNKTFIGRRDTLPRIFPCANIPSNWYVERHKLLMSDMKYAATTTLIFHEDKTWYQCLTRVTSDNPVFIGGINLTRDLNHSQLSWRPRHSSVFSMYWHYILGYQLSGNKYGSCCIMHKHMAARRQGLNFLLAC